MSNFHIPYTIYHIPYTFITYTVNQRRTMKHLFTLFFLAIGVTQAFASAEISPYLQQKMLEAMSGNQPVPAVIMLKEQVDITVLDEQLYREKASPEKRAYTVITSLQAMANKTQTPLLNYLSAQSSNEVVQYEAFWIVNMVVVKAIPAVLFAISQREDVDLIDYDYETAPIKALNERPAPEMNPNGAEPGLKLINADKLWQLGLTGAGTIVMTRDTGVDGNHPALGWRWRGNHVPWNQAWQGPGTFPQDSGDHGTHTMGTITGLDTTTHDTIGVASGAEWIASANNYSVSQSFQWAMNPDGNASTTDDMPCVISNSWGFLNSTGLCWIAQYGALLNSVEAAGIAVVFSAGNEGPGAQTITEPKNINTTLVNAWATGALNAGSSDLPVAGFSSRGPSGCPGSGSLLIKPEATAPGVSVRSSVPGGGYGFKDGTSMAAPHVSGAVALLKEAFPAKTGQEIKLALYYTAKETAADLALNDPGETPGETSGEDHWYGKGIIDVYAAYLFLLYGPQPLPPVNFSAYSDYQTPNSMHLSWTDPGSLITGTTLSPAYFHILIERNNVFIDSVAGGIQEYTDSGLIDGQEYTYSIYAKIDSTGAYSILTSTSWIAGGSPVPQPPAQLSAYGNPEQIKLKWINPSRNIDDTPMDDFAGIHWYQDSALVTFFPRSSADTARVDSAELVVTQPGYYYWYATSVDNEVPLNMSSGSASVRTPIGLTFSDHFAEGGIPNSLVWTHQNSEVNQRAVNPPSPDYSLSLNGTGIPIGDDWIESYPIDLSEQPGSGIVFSYLYQPQGQGDAPLSTDSLRLQFKNSNGEWIFIKSYGGTTLVPFQQEIISLDTLNAGSGTFFFNQFQIRLSVIGRSSPTLPRNDWFVDNLYLGVPAARLALSLDSLVFDSTQVNSSADSMFYVCNIGLLDFTVENIITPDPVFTVSGFPFLVPANSNQSVPIIFSPLQAGEYSGNLNVVTNQPDTKSMWVKAVAVPLTGLDESDLLPQEYSLSQNYPNPFNPTTMIHFELPRASEVRIEIFNLLGQRIHTLVEGTKPAGRYDVTWDGKNEQGVPLSSGIYIYRLTAGEYQRTLKMILLK